MPSYIVDCTTVPHRLNKTLCPPPSNATSRSPSVSRRLAHRSSCHQPRKIKIFMASTMKSGSCNTNPLTNNGSIWAVRRPLRSLVFASRCQTCRGAPCLRVSLAFSSEILAPVSSDWRFLAPSPYWTPLPVVVCMAAHSVVPDIQLAAPIQIQHPSSPSRSPPSFHAPKPSPHSTAGKPARSAIPKPQQLPTLPAPPSNGRTPNPPVPFPAPVGASGTSGTSVLTPSPPKADTIAAPSPPAGAVAVPPATAYVRVVLPTTRTEAPSETRTPSTVTAGLPGVRVWPPTTTSEEARSMVSDATTM